MAELTWKGTGPLTDPASGKTFEPGEPVTVSKKDAERLQEQFPDGFSSETEEEVELHSPLDVSEAKAEGTLEEGEEA